MDKRYQVFVSSTFVDLKDERQKVFQTLLEMDCIPVGMELFPAVDEEQFKFIKRVIDDSDYYILIIAGRYGSVAPDNFSYTEKEFDYAVSKGIKVIVLIHENPDDLPAGKTDKDDSKRNKLDRFRQKAAGGRLVKFWKSADEISGLVMSSLIRTIKTYPATGWVRGDKVASNEILQENTELRNEIEALKKESLSARETKLLEIENLAEFDEEYEFIIKYKTPSSSRYGGGYSTSFDHKTTWRDIFTEFAPYLEDMPNETKVGSLLGGVFMKLSSTLGSNARVDDDSLKTIGLQLEAHKLIHRNYLKTTNGKMAIFWSLTELGKVKMFELRTIKKSS